MDLAGEVEAVGSGSPASPRATGVRHRHRARIAEHATPTGQARAGPTGPRPGGAGALAVSGSAALQAVEDHGGVEAGQHVLVLGASGGVGSYAVQIALRPRRGGHRRGQHRQGSTWCSELGAAPRRRPPQRRSARRGRTATTSSSTPVATGASRDLRRALTPTGRWSSSVARAAAAGSAASTARLARRCCPASPASDSPPSWPARTPPTSSAWRTS